MPPDRDSPGIVALLGQLIEADRKKWGGMSPGAHARLGLGEIREAVSLKSGNEAPTPYGMYGSVTPGEIAAARQDGSPFGPADEEPALPSPGDIAYGRAGSIYGPPARENSGEAMDNARTLSPAEIAKGRQAEQDRDRWQALGRDR